MFDSAATAYPNSKSRVILKRNENNTYQISIIVDNNLLFTSLPFEKLESAEKMYFEITSWTSKQIRLSKTKWVNYLNKLTKRWDDKLSFKQHVGFLYQT